MARISDLYEQAKRVQLDYDLSFSASLLDHADLEKDLRKAQALLDNEQLLRQKVECDLAYEKASIESNTALNTALTNGWNRV